jgi:carnitine O-acetyltransferase
MMWDLDLLTGTNSINFNIVSKGLGSNKMSYYLNEAAGDIRELMLPTLEAAKAKL